MSVCKSSRKSLLLRSLLLFAAVAATGAAEVSLLQQSVDVSSVAADQHLEQRRVRRVHLLGEGAEQKQCPAVLEG